MAKRIILAAALVFTVAAAFPQQKAKRMTIYTDYLIYLPDQYHEDPARDWPLILFLHGAGERGNEIDRVKTHGPPKLVEAGKDFPFIIVSPQCPGNEWWSEEILTRLLDDVIEQYRVDEDRVYLTGLSMGGFGTWNLAVRAPQRFAAIAPVCGGGNVTRVWSLRHMPTWVFHGAKDRVVPLSSSQEMVDALKKYNDQVRFTVYPEAGHDSWTETYNNQELYDWFLSHVRYSPVDIKIDGSVMEKLAGSYRTAQDKLVTITHEQDGLYADGLGFRKEKLFPESELDYVTSWGNAGVRFTLDRSGKRAENMTIFNEGEIPAVRIK